MILFSDFPLNSEILNGVSAPLAGVSSVSVERRFGRERRATACWLPLLEDGFFWAAPAAAAALFWWVFSNLSNISWHWRFDLGSQDEWWFENPCHLIRNSSPFPFGQRRLSRIRSTTNTFFGCSVLDFFGLLAMEEWNQGERCSTSKVNGKDEGMKKRERHIELRPTDKRIQWPSLTFVWPLEKKLAVDWVPNYFCTLKKLRAISSTTKWMREKQSNSHIYTEIDVRENVRKKKKRTPTFNKLAAVQPERWTTFIAFFRRAKLMLLWTRAAGGYAVLSGRNQPINRPNSASRFPMRR